MGWFGARQPREVRANEVDLSLAGPLSPTSLCVLVLFGARGDDASLVGGWPSLEAVGFAAGWSSPLEGCPRRYPRLDVHTRDRFVSFEVAPALTALAEVRVSEALAYDLPYRSEINATGISVRVRLHPRAREALDQFVLARQAGLAPWAERAAGCLLRFPTARPFLFPAPRGADDPYAGGAEAVGPLRDLAALEVDAFDAAIFSYPRTGTVDWGAAPLASRVDGAALRVCWASPQAGGA